MAEAFHVLPYSGGLFDQPAGAIFKMEAVLAASTQPQVASENLAEAKAKVEERLKDSGIRRS